MGRGRSRCLFPLFLESPRDVLLCVFGPSKVPFTILVIMRMPPRGARSQEQAHFRRYPGSFPEWA